MVEVGGKRLEVTLPAGLGAVGAAGGPAPGAAAGRGGAAARRRRGASGDALTSPMQGTIVKIAVSEGEQVAAGDLVVVLEAMKMEQPLTAHKAGTVTGLTVEVGQTVLGRRSDLPDPGLRGSGRGQAGLVTWPCAGCRSRPGSGCPRTTTAGSGTS